MLESIPKWSNTNTTYRVLLYFDW